MSDGSERRRHRRADLEMAVQLFKVGQDERIATGRTVNVSPGGLLAECSDFDGDLPDGLVDVQIGPQWAKSQPTARFTARVVRTESGGTYRLAAQVVGGAPPMLFAPELIGAHPKILRVKMQLLEVANHDVNVLVRGESGTGKNVVAGLIHRYSFRSSAPFINVNCPAVPDTLLESQLFGHEKGAFTDARSERPGLFRAADKGTLVLDEISSIPPAVQAKLLQAIEEKRFIPLGSQEPVDVDVRIIASTNDCLEDMTADGRFRQDLYYRLNEVELTLPALRERKADIPLLADYFLRQCCTEFGKEYRPLDETTMRTFQVYEWPGNVRELQNVIKRGVLLGEFSTGPSRDAQPSGAIHASGADTLVVPAAGAARTIAQAREEAEKATLVRALGAAGWHRGRAAVELGVSYRTVLRRMRKFSIQPPAAPTPEAPPPAPEPTTKRRPSETATTLLP